MKKIILTLLIFYTAWLHGQQQTDYQKLSKACELWGLIKYFHPNEPGHEFDSAFAAQVPKMLDAKTDNEWKTTLNNWLVVLDDQATRVTSSNLVTASKLESIFIGDSVLYIKISGTSHFDDYFGFQDFLQKAVALIKKSNGVIFDLRQEYEIPQQYKGYLNSYLEAFGLNKSLAISIPFQTKKVYYSGFMPEVGTTSGGYSKNEILDNICTPGSFEDLDKKIIWITNTNSELPMAALSEYVVGKAIVLNVTEAIMPLLPLTRSFSFSDSMMVQFSTSKLELSGYREPKAVVYGNDSDPIVMAQDLLKNDKQFIAIPKQSLTKTLKTTKETKTSDTYPSIGYRVLAAAKIHSVIEMFFPYHQFMDKDWRTTLKESLPEFTSATNDIEYGFAVAKMYANINDSHGFIRGNKALDQLRSEAPSPLSVDWLENKIVIVRFRNDSTCRANKINIGDIITKVNGVSVEKLMKKYMDYYADSKKEMIPETAAVYCVRGKENQEGIFTIEDKTGKSRDIKLKWTNAYNKNLRVTYKLDTIQLINKTIGYADLTRMLPEQTDKMFEEFKDTKAIIFDMRGYPNGTAWTIAPRLTERQNVAVAKFRRNEVLAPNIQTGDILSYKSYTEFFQTIAPTDKWKYKGKTIMLIDDNAMSQAEHTGLFFEAVNNTVFIGSPTTGANGDVTNFTIPGGMILSFSGQGVWHADGRQLQRIGLIPHVYVKPTIKGIRANKDEVLDKALEWINKNLH